MDGAAGQYTSKQEAKKTKRISRSASDSLFGYATVAEANSRAQFASANLWCSTYPPLKAPMGLRAGRGAESAMRRAEAWKPRDESSARRVPLASILEEAGESIAECLCGGAVVARGGECGGLRKRDH
ncbi:hypothetical protein MKX07_001768 [Trichoderma sp. CBMAI-0711]|nr:hypothetical protein MKX07_001768 [Trichoderma sp. CBMAI-0711]